MNKAKFEILKYIHDSKKCTAGDIIKATGCSSLDLHDLYQSGYIIGDANEMTHKLTPAGSALFLSLEQQYESQKKIFNQYLLTTALSVIAIIISIISIIWVK